MIHVDRAKVPEPAWWRGPDFRRFLDAWAEFHGAGGTRAKQRRMVKTADAAIDLDAWRRRALSHLLEGFGGKCAYTEEPLDEGTGTVVFHRPEADAVGLDGEVWPQHYWWFVADWSNWYPASRAVRSLKGTTFPVAGERSPLSEGPGIPSRKWMDRHRDLGLLLDPCRDHPAWYLEFRDDGTVHSREHPTPSPRRRHEQSRGEITIKVLGLDREELQSRRGGALNQFDRHIGRHFRVDPATFSAFDFSESEGFFTGALRQGLARTVLNYIQAIPRFLTTRKQWPGLEYGRMIGSIAEELAAQIASLGVAWASSPIPLDLWQPLRPIFTREWPELDDEGFHAIVDGRWHPSRDDALTLEVEPEVESEATRELKFEPEPSLDPGQGIESEPVPAVAVERTVRIERIEVRNFKAIERLELDLDSEPVALPAPFDPAGEPGEEIPTAVRWTAFLGENGSGKSCCLQAIGLALAADRLDELLESARLEWRRMLRRGTERGRILVRFTGGTRLDLRFTANTHWWIGPDGKKLPEPPRMQAYVRGYGATRLLEGGPVAGSGEHVRLANLFDPRAQVLDAEAWLLGLEDEKDFNVAALTLSGFLEDRPAALAPAGASNAPEAPPLMTREDGEVRVAGDRLSDLSDGYRAIITLVCDIMAGLGAGWSDLRNARGLVLIDELGSHLHPRWKMEITGRLRRELPNVQFFVSTHEPLCLRGLFGGEVIRVRKTRPLRVGDGPPPPGAVVLERVERSPSDYRVDQLLTSEFFGLDTTIDPELDRRFQAYYRLLAMDPAERAAKGLDGRLDELRADVQSRTEPVLGFTRRDQLVYEAIDLFLSEERKLTREARDARRKKVLERIQDIWQARGAVAGGGTARRGAGGRRG